jgi:signal transduction histidine kinase
MQVQDATVRTRESQIRPAHSVRAKTDFDLTGQRQPPSWLVAPLRVPLVAKIAGANALVVVTAMVVALAAGDGTPTSARLTALVAAALGASLVVSVVLVLVALRPLDDLERVARRVWSGDLSARVPETLLADPDIERVGQAFNSILDSLTRERERIRELASQVIDAGDRERADLARELQDSTAQTLAALLLELKALANDLTDPSLIKRLEHLRRILGDVLEEVKTIAQTVHPRVLDDLGLLAGLKLLAREAEARSTVNVSVHGEPEDSLPAAQRSVLYRVAQEALNNALRHGSPQNVVLSLQVGNGFARLEVRDDGSGFDVVEAERRGGGRGLFTMRERTSLVDGTLEVRSSRGTGTQVVATVPTERLQKGKDGD